MDATTVIFDGRDLPPAGSFSPGQLVANRYRIVKLLGRGGMGEVFEADDVELHVRVALKTITLKKEIQLARKVTHPNVCRIFDVGFHEQFTFITMELLEGETLASYLQRKQRLPLDETIAIARQMAAAIDAAHAAGVIHRDFKPGNVMLAGSRAVVTDFGLAREIVRDASDPSHASRVIGTPAYMAPEQVERAETTAASDIYAFGIVLYEMLTGAMPWEGESALSALVKRLSHPPTSPRVHAPGIDPRAEYAILKCLERDPARRFKTATEAVDAMCSGGRPRPPIRAFRRLGAAAATLVVAIAGGYYLLHRTPPPPAPAGVHLRRSVAVLGFRNLSGDRNSAWVSTALAEMLSTELAAGGQLRIIPGEQVVRAKSDLALGEVESHSADTLAKLHRNLAADVVVLGSYLVLPDGDKRPLRLDLRIQDAVAGETIGAFRVDGDERTILDLVSTAGSQLRDRLGVHAEAVATKRALPDGHAAQLYAEGLEHLRLFDARKAVDLLDQATREDPDAVRPYTALAAGWLTLGYDAEARAAAKRALDLASGLPREEVLFAQARYHEAAKEWDRATEAYRALFGFYPDNIEYGLALAGVQSSARKGADALATVEKMRAIGGPASDDPRIDLAEAEGARWISDFKRQREAGLRALHKAEPRNATLLVARAHLAIAYADRNTNAPESAKSNALRALALYEARGDKAGMSAALNMVGSVEFDAGHLSAAYDWFDRALVIGRATGDRFGIARGLNNTALMMLQKGDPRAAEPRYREVVELARGIGDTVSLARALNNLAEVPYDDADFERAYPLDLEALELARKSGDRWLIANILFDLGDVELGRGHLAEATKHHQEALDIRKALGDEGIASESLLSLGEIAMVEKRYGDAEKTARDVLAATKGKRRDNERAAMMLLARALLAEGKRAEAEPIVRAAAEASRKSENGIVQLSGRILEAQFAGDRAALERIAREAKARGLALIARKAV